MSNFNLDDYEPVEARKKRFRETYPDGRIILEDPQVHTEERVVVFCKIYKNAEEQEKDLALCRESAEEYRNASYVNKGAMLENCNQSAIGRALSGAGFSGNLNCSREEILKATSHAQNQPRSVGGDDVYRVPFGKFKGRTLSEIGHKELQGYLNFIHSKKDPAREPGPQVKQFIEKTNHYLNTGE